MNTVTKKQAIVQSLDAMNASETEKVLDYIKGMLYNEARDQDHLKFKQKALQEIKDALKGDVSVPA